MSSTSVLVMPWWKSNSSANNLISSSPSSTSPSSSASSSASKGLLKDSRFFPWIRRDRHPRLTRQRRLRHLTDLEIEALSLEDPSSAFSSFTPVSRVASNVDAFPSRSASSPMLLPRPHPLPAVSMHRNSASDLGLGSSPVISVGRPLPSPLETLGRAEGDQGNGTVAEPLAVESVAGRLAYQTKLQSRQHVDKPLNQTTISYRRKLFQDPNSSGTMNFKLKIPANTVAIGEFSSPVASPVRSPRRLSSADNLVSGLPVCSSPEVSTMGLVTVFPSQTSPDKMIHSPEISPLSSPNTQSNSSKSRNPSGPPSPLHTKKFPESSTTRHDGGGNVEVHPLPLPPGASPALQSTFSHQSAAKAELSHRTNQWQKGKLLGSGTFGNVYEATNRHTGALCAMKEVNIIPDDPKSAECLKQLEQEIKFLSQFKHPNIVQYYGTETIEDHLYIYLEYVHPGSINKYVRQYCGAMTESVVRNFTRHILNGLIYLHSKNIMHRDIKGANLLVDVNGVVKLADFGMAKHLSRAAPARSLKGSPFWMAPEMLQASYNKGIGYDLAVDIWSLGCTIIEMFTGKHPWSDLEGPQAMFKVLCKDPPIPETLSSEGKDFLQRCFHRNPAERPTANMLLDHPFLWNANHYNIHGSLRTFAEIKHDNSISSKDKSKFKSESCMKKKHVFNSENNHYHPEFPELAASHLPTHSTAKVFPSLSPPHSSYIVPVQSGSSASSQIEVQLSAGSFQSHALPKPYGKEDNIQV